MNASLALARLQMMTQSSIDPGLTSGELDLLLQLAATVDDDGYEPQDDDWTPTYSPTLLNLSAAEGWGVKAGKLTAGETGSSDGANFQPDVRIARMEEKAAAYRKKVSGSFATTGRTGRYETLLASSEAVL